MRFLLGGLVVSVFAALGQLFKPKTFSGLFASAPSVAVASLALAFHQHGATYAEAEARSMVLGGVAMLAYAAACVAIARRSSVPVWFGAAVAWLAWGAVAAALFVLVRGVA